MFITRFAPSPTGYLHLGHAYAAQQAFGAAKNAGGKCLLRIEDTDQTRCRASYEQAIYDDLHWLGLHWEAPARRQSDHGAAYHKALDQLIQAGLVYRCFKTRKDITQSQTQSRQPTPTGPDGPIFFGTSLPASQEQALLAHGTAFAWRLSMSKCQKFLGPKWATLIFSEQGAGPKGETGIIRVQPDLFGDAVIARKETGTSYHLAGVHDDALQGISNVIRGQDLFYATHLHCLLQALLGLPTPQYHHHRLLTDAHGKKFAKRDQATSLKYFREQGTPLHIIEQLLKKPGLSG